jgi:hypothetical protein
VDEFFERFYWWISFPLDVDWYKSIRFIERSHISLVYRKIAKQLGFATAVYLQSPALILRNRCAWLVSFQLVHTNLVRELAIVLINYY